MAKFVSLGWAIERGRCWLAEWRKPQIVAVNSNTPLRTRFAAPRALIARLGMVTACTIIVAPALIYAALSVQQLKQRAKEQASVGARHVEIQLANSNALDRLNEVSISVLHATGAADSPVIASWVTDISGKLLMFQGASVWWPEFKASELIRARNFEGHFNIAVSTREVFTRTFGVFLAFVLLGATAYYCFRRLPLAALDDALNELNARQLELESQSDQLASQNLRFDAALNNMVQGLAMFDHEHRVVIANARYAEIYGLTSEQVGPGTALRQILEHRIANGHDAGRSIDDILNSVLRRMAEHDSSHYLSELTDGRCIAVSVQRMADGGTVTTHQDITEQRRSEARIAHLALHDALTGLPNRALLNERLEHALARAKRGEIVATLIMDLDQFKHVNDTLGHPVGDRLLQMVGDRLRALVRETDTIARMGGDEFAVVQVALTKAADATSLAERILTVVSEPYEIEGHHVVIGTSVGISIGPADGSNPDQLIRNADLALYRAKADGRGTFRFFEASMDEQMQARRTLEHDLRKALAAGEFELHYQPVLKLSSDKICGFEALIRWNHPEKGLVSPGAFIPLAEEIGLIVPIGEWVIREACATVAKWPDDLKVAVNLSPAHFRTPGLLDVVTAALERSGLQANRLELEITESILLQNSEATLAVLFQLRQLGVQIAMDDFGTGYSSLSYLQSFPFDKIKIDRSFIKNITESASSLNIVRAVAALASGMGVAATAEGVETKEQLEAIRLEGCTEMQGFLYSKALPPREIERVFLSQLVERDTVVAA